MKITADRGVEIAQGIELIYAIANKYGLVIEENTNGDVSWFELWADGVDDIVGLCDTVRTTFGEEIR